MMFRRWFGGGPPRPARAGRRSGPRQGGTPGGLSFETLEDRRLLAVTATFTAGTLGIDSDAADPVAITVLAGNVRVNGTDPVNNDDPGNPVASTGVQTIDLQGIGNFSNAIDLTGVTPADFTNLNLVVVVAGGGADAVIVREMVAGSVLIESESITLAGPVTTTIGQSYDGDVVLGEDVVITDSGALGVDFNGALDSDGTARSLTVNTPGGGRTFFGGAIGDVSPLNSLTTVAPGDTVINTTTIRAVGGTVTFNDTVILTQDVTITDNGTTGVFFNSTLNSDATARSLTVNTTGGGVTRFGGVVGGVKPLDTLITDALGTTQVAADITSAALDLNDSLLLETDVTLTGRTSVDFAATIDSAAGLMRDLTVASPITIFQGDIGAAVNGQLGALTTDAVGTTTIDTTTIRTAGGTVTFNDPVVLGADVTITDSGATGVFFNSTIDSDATPRNLIVNTTGGGVTRFGGSVGGINPLSTLTTDALGGTNIDTTTITANGGTVTFNDPVVLGADVTITDSGATGVFFNNTVNSDATPRSLTVNTTGGGVTRFGGSVGGINPLSTLTTDALGGTNIDTTTITANGGTVTFNDPVLLGADVTITDSGATGVFFNSTIDSDATPRSLTVNTTGGGVTRFGGAVGGNNPLSTLTTDALGGTNIDTTTIAANGGTVTFNDPVVLGADVTITDSGATGVFFNSTIDSDATPRNLIVNTTGGGVTRFGGSVGGINPLSTLTTDALGGTNIDTTTITANGGTVTFNDPVVLGADVTITDSGATGVFFNSTIDSDATPRSLTVNTTGGGATRFGGVVGGINPLSTLTTDAPGVTEISPGLGGMIMTDGDQTYGDRVTVGANTILTAANVAFSGTADDDGNGATPSNLTIQASGTTQLSGIGLGPDGMLGTGDDQPLTSLTVHTGGPFAVDHSMLTTGDMHIEVVEANPAAAGDDLTIFEQLPVVITARSTGGNIVLRAGDDLTIQADTVVEAAFGTVSILGDFGDNDVPGTTVTIHGAVTGNVVLVEGADDDDIFLLDLAESMGSFQVAAFDGSDTIDLPASAAGTVTHIDAGSDNDQINVGSATGTLDAVLGDVSVDGGLHDPVDDRTVQGGGFVDPSGPFTFASMFMPKPPVPVDKGDTLNIHDNNDLQNNHYVVTSSMVVRTGGPTIDYEAVEILNLEAGMGDDLVTIELPDVVPPALPSVVTVNGGDGNDQVTIQGTAAGDDITVGTIATDPTTRAPIEIDAVESLHVLGGAGDDVIVNQTNGGAGTPSMLEGEDGDDVLVGGPNVDVMFGGPGVDALFGGLGSDYLFADMDGSGAITIDDGDLVFGNFGKGNDPGFVDTGVVLVGVGAVEFDKVDEVEILYEEGAVKGVWTWLTGSFPAFDLTFNNQTMMYESFTLQAVYQEALAAIGAFGLDPIAPANPVVVLAALEVAGWEIVHLAGESETEAAPSWQNGINRFDVNGDGHVSPIDALLVVNQLNEGGARPLSVQDAGADGPPIYLDVNGDLFVSPIDVLHIVNHLNRLAGGGSPVDTPAEMAEGESARTDNDDTEPDARAAAAPRLIDPTQFEAALLEVIEPYHFEDPLANDRRQPALDPTLEPELDEQLLETLATSRR